MQIRTQNDRVLTRDGLALCSCCDEIDIPVNISIGPDPTECDCETVICFDPANPLAPVASPTYIANGVTQTNPYFPTADFVGSAFLQIPWDLTTTPGPGWRNVVSEPSIVRLQGQVGGDLRVVVNKTVLTPDPTFPQLDVIVDEGDFACGVCATDRNGSHSFNYTFAIKPNVIFYIDIRTYFICRGWLRASLSRVGPYTPP